MYFRAQASAMTLTTRQCDLVLDRLLLGDAGLLAGFGDELHVDELIQKLPALLSRHFPTALPGDVGEVLFELRFRDVPAVDGGDHFRGPRARRGTLVASADEQERARNEHGQEVLVIHGFLVVDRIDEW